MSAYFFDTNALVYWVYPGSSFHDEVNSFLTKLFETEGQAYALNSSLNDVYYALCRHYTDEQTARDSLRDIAEVFDMLDLTTPMVFEALDLDEPDYEDGLIRTAAESLQVNAIVSYDKKAFRHSFVPRVTARQALYQMES